MSKFMNFRELSIKSRRLEYNCLAIRAIRQANPVLLDPLFLLYASRLGSGGGGLFPWWWGRLQDRAPGAQKKALQNYVGREILAVFAFFENCTF